MTLSTQPVRRSTSARRSSVSSAAQLTASFTGGILLSEEDVAALEEEPVAADDPEERMPPLASLVSVCLWLFLCTASFIIPVPTTLQYVQLLHGSSQVAGAVIGATPFATALVQPLWAVVLFRRLKLRTILLGFCCVIIVGDALYALAGVADSFSLLLVGRGCIGLVSGPQAVTTYVGRSVGLKKRSGVMLYVMLSAAAGYCFGLLLSVFIEVIADDAKLTADPLKCADPAYICSTAFNGPSLVGWVSLACSVLMLLIIFCFVEEPASPKPSLATSVNAAPPELQPVPFGGLARSMLILLVFQMMIGAWEVHTANRVQVVWGWSEEMTGVYEFLLLLAAAAVLLIKFAKYVNDRQGILVFMSGGVLAGCIFVGSYLLLRDEEWASGEPEHGGAFVGGIAVYTVASFLLMATMQVGQCFVLSQIQKFVLPSVVGLKAFQMTMAVNASVFNIGRGTGALVAGFLDYGPEFSLLVLCGSLGAVGVTLLSWTVFSAVQ